MPSILLTETGWKAVAQKFKIKDTSLQKALVLLQTFDGDEYTDRLKGIGSVIQLANSVKKSKEAAACPEVVKYLASLLSAAESEQIEIAKAKAAAEKAEAMTRKQADAGAKQRGEDGDKSAEETEQGDYKSKLLAAFQRLKGAKNLSCQFIICDAKPHAAIMIAKLIGPKHKEELTKVTNGSKRFLHLGTCQFQDGKFTFAMEQPVSGLARKLQDSIKYFTGKKLPIKVGEESAEADEQASPVASAQAAPATGPEAAALAKAPEVWHKTREVVGAGLEQLKAAVRKEYAGEHPDLLAEIDRTMAKLDGILGKLDTRLADSLGRAHAAQDPAARRAELDRSRNILKEYLKYVESEPLIARIDSNPFGVSMNLKQTLAQSLLHMGHTIG